MFLALLPYIVIGVLVLCLIAYLILTIIRNQTLTEELNTLKKTVHVRIHNIPLGRYQAVWLLYFAAYGPFGSGAVKDTRYGVMVLRAPDGTVYHCDFDMRNDFDDYYLPLIIDVIVEVFYNDEKKRIMFRCMA